jgi:hypothetical protein
MVALFEIFWPHHILEKIVCESNRYATELGQDEKTRGGPHWENMTIPELKAFFAVLLYMGMKRQPNRKSYWHKIGSIFHCPIISNIMSHRRFETLMRCLHLTNPESYVHEKGVPGYDKMGQLRWLLIFIRDCCKRAWHLGKNATIDKMMIRYKGLYCPSHQYMLKKPQKWGIKVWCLVYSQSKFVVNFEIYCGKSQVVQETQSNVGRESTLAHNVVLDLLTDYGGKGTCDNNG